MKKTKIIITICMVAVLMMTLCVSTFASGNVLKGEQTEGEPDSTEIIGTWVFNDTLDLSMFTSDSVVNITFESDNIQFSAITIDRPSTMLYQGNGSNYRAYNSGTWENEARKTITISAYDDSKESLILELLNTNATKTAPLVGGSSSVGILDVASEIPSFLTTGLTTVTALFYTDGELTFVGYLAIASLAISVCFLVISIIRNFLHFRG